MLPRDRTSSGEGSKTITCRPLGERLSASKPSGRHRSLCQRRGIELGYSYFAPRIPGKPSWSLNALPRWTSRIRCTPCRWSGGWLPPYDAPRYTSGNFITLPSGRNRENLVYTVWQKHPDADGPQHGVVNLPTMAEFRRGQKVPTICFIQTTFVFAPRLHCRKFGRALLQPVLAIVVSFRAKRNGAEKCRDVIEPQSRRES